MAKRFRRGLPIPLIVLMLGLLWPGTAFAHAAYKESDPGDESTVSSAPSSVWAEFTEPLSNASTLKVFDPCGVQVDGDDVEISGYRMSVSMASERQGEFTVRFLANSALDGHTTGGDFTFSATVGEPCASGAEEERQEQEPSNDSEEEQDSTVAGPSDTSPDGGGSQEAGGSDDRGDGSNDARGSDEQKARNAGDRKDKTIILTADEIPEAPEGPSLFDIPWGSFGLALLFAVVIGAAGGKVYAGIMGPRA